MNLCHSFSLELRESGTALRELGEGCATALRAAPPVILAVLLAAICMLLIPEATAGTSTTFATLETETTNAVFGPLGRAVIVVVALAGGILTLLKGTWLFAALGVAVAGLMFLAQTVANSGTFTAVLPFAA